MKKLLLYAILTLFSATSYAQWISGGTTQGITSGNKQIRWQFGSSGFINGYTKGQIDSLFTASGGSYVPTSRLISTGIGLLGGGNLASNLTLLVDTTTIGSKAWANARFATLSGLGSYLLKTDSTAAQGYARNWQLTNLLAAKASLASPALTGIPTAPTATLGTNTTQIATMAAIQEAIAGSGAGSVATVSVVTANGVSGSVANPTTTPAITLTLGDITPTSTNGVSATTMAYNDATSSIQTQLNGKLATGGTAANSTLWNGQSNTLSGLASGNLLEYDGATWRNVINTYSSPLIHTGGNTSISQATGATNGYLSAADWTTFNAKQAAIGYTPENVANKATNLTSPDNTKYPTTLAVANAIAGHGSGTVTNVSGTTDRITVANGTTTPVINISTTFENLLGKVANPLSQFASTTSAQLRSTLSDETGTGAAYFQSGDLGTPSAGVLTNATGTASGLTSGAVTSIGNLTGDVTSVNRATTIASINGITPTYYDVTGSIQTQLNSKQSSLGYTPVNKADSGNVANNYVTYGKYISGATTQYNKTFVAPSSDRITLTGVDDVSLITTQDLSIVNSGALANSLIFRGNTDATRGYITFGNSANGFGYDGTNLVYGSDVILNSGNFSTYAQPVNAKLTAIGALANASGVLTNNGSGAFSYTTPTTGTVTDVSVVTANGISGSVATSTTTPAITLSLGAITPTTINASSTITGIDNLSMYELGATTGFDAGIELIPTEGNASTQYINADVPAGGTPSLALQTQGVTKLLLNGLTGVNTFTGDLGVTGNVTGTNLAISNWNTAYSQTRQWDGGATGLTAATGRTSLGGTTVGQNFFTLTNPSAITFPRINADNSVSALDAAAFRTAIGAGTSSATGTVTDVAALTLGTTGTDLSSSVANGTTTPVITLNVPTASASNRGALSSTDWSTFNGKQAALVSGTNIKTVGSTSILGSGDIPLPTTLPPSGSAGGDLTGTYPNPTVNTINSITKSYYDPTSSIQTQLDSKLSTATAASTYVAKVGGTPNAVSGRLFAGVASPTQTAAGVSSTSGIQVNDEVFSGGSLAGVFWGDRANTVTPTTNWYGWYSTGGNTNLYNGSTNILSISNSGAVTATSFAGAGTGLTGTASGLNIGGSAASLSAASTLPNNTLATTQSANDNSTKVATTAYVDGAVTTAAGGYVATSGNQTGLAGNKTWTGVHTFNNSVAFTPNILVSGSIDVSAATNTVSGSTSGDIVGSMPFQGISYKKIMIYCNSLLGTATYTFPTVFTYTPQIVVTNGPASSVVTALSTTAVTITGATTTGFVLLEGY